MITEEQIKLTREEAKKKYVRERRSDSDSISKSDTDTSGHTGNKSSENGDSVYDLSGQSIGIEIPSGYFESSTGKSGSGNRVVSQSDSRLRPAIRRPGKDNSKDRSDGTDVPASVGVSTGKSEPVGPNLNPIRKIGNLFTDDKDIPIRKDTDTTEDKDKRAGTPATEIGSTSGTQAKGKRGRPKKQGNTKPLETIKETIEQTHVAPKFLQQGKVLSKQEAAELKEPLEQALKDDFEYLDMYLQHVAKNNDQVWSDADDEEISMCVRLWLKQGMRNPMAAESARAMAEGSDYLSFMFFAIPRLHKTWKTMQNRPRKEKMKSASKSNTTTTVS